MPSLPGRGFSIGCPSELPSCRPMSCKTQMWAWFRLAMVRASRSNRSCSLFFGTTQHPLVWFQRIDLLNSCRIVERKIRSRSYADLKNVTLCQRHDALPNLGNGLRVPKNGYEMRIDAFSIKAHLETRAST